jgi:hypothetical protein
MITRRHFILKTAITTFGVSLAPAIPVDLLAQKIRISPNEKLVIGLIGCNSKEAALNGKLRWTLLIPGNWVKSAG